MNIYLVNILIKILTHCYIDIHYLPLFPLPFYACHQFQEERPEGGFAHAAPPISRHRAGRLQGSCLDELGTGKRCDISRESYGFV